MLIGTYELLALRNLSAQLSRRSVDVHFRRYRAEHNDELKAFKNVLWSFQNHLPLHEQPDLIGEWDYFYERSVGCIGVLKVWLTRALAKALKDGGKVLAHKHLEKAPFPSLNARRSWTKQPRESHYWTILERIARGYEVRWALKPCSQNRKMDMANPAKMRRNRSHLANGDDQANVILSAIRSEMINSLNNESLSIYESWNIEMPSVSTRSRLYNLEPIGMGTGRAESLTSYIARLAAAHSLTPAVLLGRTLASFMDKKYWLQGGARPELKESLG